MTERRPEPAVQHEKYRGRTVLRRGQVDSSTTDQRLLDSRGPSDWVHTDPWRVLRIQSEFVDGFGALLVSYRGYSGNAGTPTEEGLYADARAALDCRRKPAAAPIPGRARPRGWG